MSESKSTKRLYCVSEQISDDEMVEKLVRATSQASAIRHLVMGRFIAEPAKPEDIVRLMGAGVLVQEAGAE